MMMMIIKKTKTNWKKEKEKEEKNDEILYENYVYKLSNSNKLLQFFLVVIGKDIYYYKTNTKEEFSSPKTKKSFFDINTPQMSGMKGKIRMNNELIPNDNNNNQN